MEQTSTLLKCNCHLLTKILYLVCQKYALNYFNKSSASTGNLLKHVVSPYMMPFLSLGG